MLIHPVILEKLTQTAIIKDRMAIHSVDQWSVITGAYPGGAAGTAPPR